MKKMIALLLGLMMLMTCATALGEAEKASMGVLKVSKAFDIRYSPLPNDYQLSITRQDADYIHADIEAATETQPRMDLVNAFSDLWEGTEKLNDVSEEDLEAVRESFREEYPDAEFSFRETAYGTKLMLVTTPTGQDAYIYTIYKEHEIEIHIFTGLQQDALEEADIERVVDFLSNMDFVQLEDE